MKGLRALLALGLLLALPGMASAGGLNLQTLDGRRADLGELLSHDKWTLVMVWTTYCGVCRTQYPVIGAFHAAHKDKDAVVLGISLDGYDQGEKVRAYQVSHAQNFPSVLASAEDFTDKYQRTTGERFTGTPTYLLFDPGARLRAYIDGPISAADIEGYIGGARAH